MGTLCQGCLGWDFLAWPAETHPIYCLCSWEGKWVGGLHGEAGGRQSSRHGSEEERAEHLRSAQTLKVGTEDWHQSVFTLHRVHVRWISPCLSQQEAPSRLGKQAGVASVLRLLAVHCSVSFSPHPHPHVNVPVSRVPAGSYRNYSSFPFIFVSQLIRKLGKKAVCLEWEVRLHRGA